MFELLPSNLPPLPLLLWEPPPGLELILRQEGIATARVRDPHPLAFRGGRFVLYDGRKVSAATVRATLSPDHVPLDIDLLRQEDGSDPFEALIDTRAAPATWRVGRWSLTERVGRVPKAELRRRLLDRLRQTITERRRTLGCGLRRSRSRTARPSTSGPTSTSRSPRTTPASPGRAGPWPTAVPTS